MPPGRPRKHKLPKHELLSISKRISDLLAKKKALLDRKDELEKQIYKLETDYLENGQGAPITTSLDAYIGSRGEKKKYLVNAKDRIFSTLLPKVYRE